MTDTRNLQRNLGVDALRVLATFMVLILHILNIGGIIRQTPTNSPAYWSGLVLFLAAFSAVNCYGLISGYVGLYARYRYAKLAMLWLQVVFYNLVGLVVLAFVVGQPLEAMDFWQAFSPLIHRSFWYFTAYFGLFFLMPILNRGVQALTAPQARMLGWSLVVLFSLAPTLMGADWFVTQAGYTALWLVLLYLLGACMRKGQILSRTPGWVLLGIYLLGVAVSVLLRWILLAQSIQIGTVQYNSYTLISYTSPTILLCAMALLGLFARRSFRGRWSRRLIGTLAPASFGIYILHMQPQIQDWLFNLPLFAWVVQQNAAILVAVVLLMGLCLYIVCWAVEYLRQWIFRILRIQKRLERLETKLLGNFWDAH